MTLIHRMALSTKKYENYWMWQPSERGAIINTTLRVSDTGLQNMSGLDFYLTRLFLEFNKQIPTAMFPAWITPGW